MKVSRKDIAAIIAGTFPDYTGRKLHVEAATSVTLYGLNWDGGSRNQFRACTIAGEVTGGSDAYNAQSPWRNQGEGKTLSIPQGFVVVEHTIFCGKDCGLRVYVNPADMPRWLPAASSVPALA